MLEITFSPAYASMDNLAMYKGYPVDMQAAHKIVLSIFSKHLLKSIMTTAVCGAVPEISPMACLTQHLQVESRVSL